jgi:ribosomal-protein-alanine N-acetyltransferase
MPRHSHQQSKIHLQTPRLWLSPWIPSDSVAFRPIAQNPQVMRYITGGRLWTDIEIREFLARQMRHFAQRGFCFWKLSRKPDGRLIGIFGMQAITIAGRREVEIGWWLAPPAWGRGLASEAARAVLRAAFHRAHLRRVIAIAMPENRASRRVMEKIGMRYERNTTRRGFDVVLYSTARPPRP